ncbi:hypothetical protein DAPPUDRAFT_236764 [Daphnia pulex]|uniref:Uncharacterized protein n=1 Tax=Daphnia pulex TaxID=6669 RepID=E9G313_DAPPU|nr:hypothetical protein DAPPUDRAFT_236764 [Daphnia pulex]|eukprot:EFX86409.1 hypothetical protein DAPPUDRAFT_236764 [Daphnia pulex]
MFGDNDTSTHRPLTIPSVATLSFKRRPYPLVSLSHLMKVTQYYHTTRLPTARNKWTIQNGIVRIEDPISRRTHRHDKKKTTTPSVSENMATQGQQTKDHKR